MDTLPLPPRPDLEPYEKRAKDLVAAASSKDVSAVHAWATDWLGALAGSLGVAVDPFVQHSFERAVGEMDKRVQERSRVGRLSLADAQLLIAEVHGFASWAEFASHIEGLFRGDGGGREFEAAADAIVSGDVSTLERLLREQPELVRARSARVHAATLLHYVAANGVEDFRQKTPPDAPAIARLLLDTGAEVDALAETYGGGKAQTTMNLLVSSAHPHEAGLQAALVEVLLDHGAAINGLEDDGSPLMTAIAFGYGGAAETLARRGARLDNVVAAAAVGREDLVRSLVIDRATLAPSVRNFETRWFRTPGEPEAHIEMALAFACAFGRGPIARYLLDMGVSVTAKDKDDMTALHWAAAKGSLELMDELISRGAPLEARNTWGGTVLGSTCYFAIEQPFEGVDYTLVIRKLIAAGAEVGSASWARSHPTVGPLLSP